MAIRRERARMDDAFGGGGKAITGATEAENTLLSSAIAEIVDILGEGPMVGLVNGAKSIYFDDVPLQNADDSYNFKGVEWEARTGTEDQDAISIINDTETEVGVGTQVTKTFGPVTENLSGDYDGFRVRIRVPSLLYVDGDGNIKPYSVKFAIKWSPEGEGTFQHITGSPFTLTGKNDAPYYADYEFDPPVEGGWDIRVERISDDDPDVKHNSDIYFDAMVGVLHQKLIYPYSALVAYKVNAEQFGSSIPERSYDVKGRIVRVPTNYDPETRVYTGLWDGTFKLAWTDNPAWCWLDLATNTRYGAGYPDNEINVAGLYTIAKYCDELVPDGHGGEEPRWTLNVCINTRENAYDLFNKIATVFRGMVFWAEGQINFSSDRPKPVSYLATPANTERGIFIYRSTSDASRANQIFVSYNNPDDGDRPDIEIVEDNKDILSRGVRSLEIKAWGCRSQGQAHRVGEWLLYTLHHDTEVVSYTAGMDHDTVLPGEIIAIADPIKSSNKAAGGRIRAISGEGNRTITIDRDLQLSATTDYQIMIADEDQVCRYYDLETATGSPQHDFVLTSDLIGSVPPGNMFMIFEKDVGQRLFQITSVEERGGKRVISGLLYNPSKFDYIERDQPLGPVPGPVFADGELAGPRYFAYTLSQVERAGTTNRIDLLLSWTAPESDNRVLDYQLQIADDEDVGDFRDIYVGRSTSFLYQDLNVSTFKAVRIRTRGVGGIVSGWQVIANIQPSTRNLPPPTPADIDVRQESQGSALRVSWEWIGNNPPPDFMYVEVYRALTTDIEDAVLIAIEPGSYYLDTNLEFGITYYYWIRTRVYTENVSAQVSAFLGPETAVVLAPPITDVLDESITSAKIADAAVIAEKIAPYSITATKMVLTDFFNYFPDYEMLDPDFYYANTPADTDVIIEPSENSIVGQNRLRIDGPNATQRDVYTNWFAVTPNTPFMVTASAWMSSATAGSGSAIVTLQFTDIDDDGEPTGTITDVAVVTTTDSTTVVRSIVNTVSGSTHRRARFRLRKNGTGSGKAMFGGLAVRRRMNAELIVDGSIIADKIAANAVTADKINVTTLSAIVANLGTVTAGLIQSTDGNSYWNLSTGAFRISGGS